MSSSSRNPLYWFKENASAIGAISLIVAATWVVTRYTFISQITVLEKELELYKETQEVDLPKLLDELENFVGSANVQLELSSLQEEHSKLQSDYETLTKSYDELNNTYTELKQTAKLEEKFTLKVGESHTILNGMTIVGMRSIHSSSVRITLDEAPESLEIGESSSLAVGGISYRLILEKVSSDLGVAEFRVDEIPQEQ